MGVRRWSREGRHSTPGGSLAKIAAGSLRPPLSAMALQIWDAFPCDHYLSLVPWAGLGLESEGTPRPFPLIAGVAPDVVASLHEAHGLLSNAVTDAITDVASARASPGDSVLRVRVED